MEIYGHKIHHSYKVVSTHDDHAIVSYNLKINQEFISKILEYGKDVIVMEPDHLKNQIKHNLIKALKNKSNLFTRCFTFVML